MKKPIFPQMANLVIAKQYIKYFIAKYEVYLLPLSKFALSFLVLVFINDTMGYMTRLDSVAVVLIAALMCSFMPQNFSVVMAAAFIIAHLYAVSLECAVVITAMFILMFLLYYRFSPKDTLVLLLTPICFYLKIPYVIPLALGLLSTPLSAVSAACGVIVYYTLAYIVGNIATLTAMAADDMAVRFRYIIDGIMQSREMLVMVAAFAAIIIVVYLIRRLSIAHSWLIATVTGSLLGILVLLLGDLMWDAQVDVWGTVLAMLIAIALTKIIEFFAFHVDFNRAEKVQFEDDEYYYYVKAVPKITVATPARKVKKIHSPRKGE